VKRQTETRPAPGRPHPHPETGGDCRDLVRQAGLLRRAGDRPAAEKAYRQAARECPQCDRAWAELGCFLADCRHFSEACDCLRRALTLRKPAAGVSGPISVTEEDAPREAIRLLDEVAAGSPAWAPGQFSLGCAYESIGDYVPARIHLRRALALDASLEPRARCLLARMYWQEGKPVEAIAEAELAREADPSYSVPHALRATFLYKLGRMEEAVVGYRQAIEIAPDAACHDALLRGLNFLSDTTPEALNAEAGRWNSVHAAPLARYIRPHDNRPEPDRLLKIGYVSPDLYQHPMMRFLPPVLEHHDRSRFEVTVYSVGSSADVVTEELRRKVPRFVSFHGSGAELAARVRADGIDILVDLAGHTMDWAIYQAFAHKPAPVQVSWLGFLSTTGLTTMDYFLGDALMPCPGTEHLYSEKVYRIPGAYFCYRPFADVPLAPAPCLERGYITFGSFHKPAKTTRPVVQLWSEVLHAVPGSRLLMKYRDLDTPVRQQRFIDWFAECGIAKERVEFAGISLPLEYLAAYNEIDIALDPFPYNGGSTSLDTLWMGVPFVTMAGRLAVERDGADILTHIGSPDLIAETPEQYVRAAVFLADAVPRISDLRRNVRRALQTSCLMDEAGLVHRVEDAFREMWRAWCRTESETGHAA